MCAVNPQTWVSLDVIDDLEATCRDLERRLGVWITIHDAGSISYSPDGATLLPYERRMHKHPVCQMHRKERDGWELRCLEHCQNRTSEQAVARAEPFVHRCWKGMTEVVIPVHRDGVHVATVFVGGYAADEPPADLDEDVREALVHLPQLDQQTAAANARIVGCFIQGLITILDRQRRPRHQVVDRYPAILGFIRTNIAQPIGLPDLARELNLSESRTSHIVRQLFGRSFQQLLATQRITRARTMLATTELTLRQIAVEVGLGSEYYFSRVFRRYVGMPPGRYRRTHGQ